jgi:DNA-binding transcriptional LysR family regulator
MSHFLVLLTSGPRCVRLDCGASLCLFCAPQFIGQIVGSNLYQVYLNYWDKYYGFLHNGDEPDKGGERVRDISIKQLRAFLSVAATHNFSQAAAKLHVSPSALSLSIQELESRVGLRLFDRSTRSVALTATGVAFFPVADRLVSDFARAIDDLVAAPAQERGRVFVGAAASVITNVLGEAIADLYKLNNRIDVRLIEDTTQTLTGRVARGELDFGITTLWTKVDSLTTVPFLDDRLGIIAAPGHSLAKGNTPIQWKELRGHNLVSLTAGAGLRARMELDAKISNVLNLPSHEVSSVSALCTLVKSGLGTAVVPALTALDLDPRFFVFRPLVNPVSWRNLFFVRARGGTLSSAALALLTSTNARLKSLERVPHVRPNRAFSTDIGASIAT